MSISTDSIAPLSQFPNIPYMKPRYSRSRPGLPEAKANTRR